MKCQLNLIKETLSLCLDNSNKKIGIILIYIDKILNGCVMLQDNSMFTKRLFANHKSTHEKTPEK